VVAEVAPRGDTAAIAAVTPADGGRP
jgi:hypothetical protein